MDLDKTAYISLFLFLFLKQCLIFLKKFAGDLRDSLVAQRIKCLPAILRETRVRSLGWEDPPEKEMATHFSILVWRIPWTEERGGLQPTGLQKVGHD